MNPTDEVTELEGRIRATREQLHDLERELLRIRRQALEPAWDNRDQPDDYYVLPIAG